jgi:hypothetical protein
VETWQLQGFQSSPRPSAPHRERNHNPRVGGSSPSSGIPLFAGKSRGYGGFGGFDGSGTDRYEPLKPLTG